MKTSKRILALIASLLLFGMYGITLVFAFIHHPMSSRFLMASIACTVILPVLLYAYLLVYKLVHKQDTDHTEEQDINPHL